VFPFCLYKDVHKLKYYAVFVVFTNFLIFIVLIFGSIPSFRDPNYTPTPNKEGPSSVLYGCPVFCIAFEFQYYFIALYSKLEKTNKVSSGNKLNIIINIFQLFYAIGICIFYLFALEVEKHPLNFF
jgi:amino acid permease